ncbi:MAG: RHS repeat domain-containing protein [Methylococcales bacterium]
MGNLIKVTLPDGGYIAYVYDAAHRLTGINDHKGNRIVYTLDNMGNRIGEQAEDAEGLLVRNISRVIDALNRVQQITGRHETNPRPVRTARVSLGSGDAVCDPLGLRSGPRPDPPGRRP